MAAVSALAEWVERSALCRDGDSAPVRLRFAFYGRVSTEDWQEPATSRSRQREQAGALVRGHGQIVAEFFDVGHTRSWHGPAARSPLPWLLSLPTRTGDGTRSWSGSTGGRSTAASTR